MQQSVASCVLWCSKDTARSQQVAQELTNLGVDVIFCHDTEAAAAVLLSRSVQAVLTDLQLNSLAGFDGLQILKHVKSHFPFMPHYILANRPTPELGNLLEAHPKAELLHFPTGIKRLLERLGQRTTKHQRGNLLHISPLANLLEESQLKCCLQPILSIQPSEFALLGAESLARINSPVALDPELLFAYAAEKEQTFELDSICILKTLKTVQGLFPFGKLFVNVRPRSLVHPHFAEHLAGFLDQTKFPTQRIVLELTEQQPVLNMSAVKSTVKELQSWGIKIALDDFGVGFANLQTLGEIKPDYIKLPGVFCRDIEHDSYQQTIIKTIAQMAKALRIETILENVETASQLEAARTFGIDHAQGYYLSKPVPKDEFVQKWGVSNHFSVSCAEKPGI